MVPCDEGELEHRACASPYLTCACVPCPQNALEGFTQRRALRCLARAVRAIPPERRRTRLAAAQERAVARSKRAAASRTAEKVAALRAAARQQRAQAAAIRASAELADTIELEETGCSSKGATPKGEHGEKGELGESPSSERARPPSSYVSLQKKLEAEKAERRAERKARKAREGSPLQPPPASPPEGVAVLGGPAVGLPSGAAVRRAAELPAASEHASQQPTPAASSHPTPSSGNPSSGSDGPASANGSTPSRIVPAVARPALSAISIALGASGEMVRPKTSPPGGRGDADAAAHDTAADAAAAAAAAAAEPAEPPAPAIGSVDMWLPNRPGTSAAGASCNSNGGLTPRPTADKSFFSFHCCAPGLFSFSGPDRSVRRGSPDSCQSSTARLRALGFRAPYVRHP